MHWLAMTCNTKIMPVGPRCENLKIPPDMENSFERLAARRIGLVREAFGFGTWTLDDALKAAYLQGMADMGHVATLDG